MNRLLEKLIEHAQHIKEVSKYCTTEETTKQALIIPMLNILGFKTHNPKMVKAEYISDFMGAKSGERVDYALFCDDIPVMFIEAKAISQDVDQHCPQLARYFNATPEVTIAAITNGIEWRFFTDLTHKNVMDKTPFLSVNLLEPTLEMAENLFRFQYKQFKPDALRVLAEETIYLDMFSISVKESLKKVDDDFVRFIANKSKVNRQLSQKFVDQISPIVKKAVQKAMSEMVINSLTEQQPKENEASDDVYAPIVDPNNPNIITTYNERKIFEYTKSILGDESDIIAKDTASYYSILYQGKVNRWLFRYNDKQVQSIILPFDLSNKVKQEIKRAGLKTNNNQIILNSPLDILKISGLVFDCLDYCKNDENFRVKKTD